MSSSTDILIYASPSGKANVEKLNELIAANARFEPKAWPVETSEFSGPNVFYGDLYAFGADYFLSHELQEMVDSIEWKCPMEFVAICNDMWDTKHQPEVRVVRPSWTVIEDEQMAWYGECEVKQTVTPWVPYEERPKP